MKSRAALFIDGSNVYATAKMLGFQIDYMKLLAHVEGQHEVLRAYYYTAMIEDQEISSIRPLIDFLVYNRFAVITKATKKFIGVDGREKIKGNMDIEMAVDMFKIAPHVTHMWLLTGDGDFRCLVEAMQDRGVHVTVCSTIETRPAMIADELRRQCDIFVDLKSLRDKIIKTR